MLKRKLKNPSQSDGTRPAKAHRQTFSGSASTPAGSSIHGRTKITTRAPSRTIPNSSTQVGGVMIPNYSTDQVQKRQQIRALIRALYHNNIHQQDGLKKLFKYLGFDLDLLSPSPTARTPKQLGISTSTDGSTRSSAPREHSFGLFQAIQAAQTSNQDPEQILQLIRETFSYLYQPKNQNLLARLMQQTNPQTLQALFSPFQVEHGRASLYQFTQDGYMELIILHLPKATL
ncbi:MAG: hypothetical protein P1U32_08540, partial [Legionellaceae bacterium]|nr:hypothetical protein [Legionellaceae bacterium]